MRDKTESERRRAGRAAWFLFPSAFCLLASAFLSLAACRTPAPTLPVQEIAEISPASGEVSAALLSDPNAPSLKLGPDEQFIPARLWPWNPSPIYPNDLVGLKLIPYIVVLRITFDDLGQPLEISDSPLGTTTSGPHRANFEEVARSALETWRCDPPIIRKFRPGPDNDGDGKPDYRIMVDQRRYKTFFDVAFTFEIVNGQPVVRSSEARRR